MSYSALITSITQAETALHRLTEAAKRRKLIAVDVLAKPIAKLDAQIGGLFIRQGNALVRALSPIRSLLKEDAISNQFDTIFDDATQATSVDMLDALTQSYKNTLLLGGTNQLSETGIKISFKLDNPRAAQYIQQYGAEQIDDIDAHTKQDIRNLLRAGIENGESYTTIASAIRTRFRQYAEGSDKNVRSRSRLIAVTELGNGYAAGSHASMQAVQDSGLQMEKHWLTVGDLKVSDGCKANQAQNWIPLNQAHLSGHIHPLRFPGCRCVEQYQRIKGAASVSTGKQSQVDQFTLTTTGLENIQKELDAEYDLKSQWNGNFDISPGVVNSAGGFNLTSHDITIHPHFTDKPDMAFHIAVHEMTHSYSGVIDKKGVVDKYLAGGIGWEEATVEGNVRIHLANIAEKVGYTFDDSDRHQKTINDLQTFPYMRYITPMEKARKQTGLTEEDFYGPMLKMNVTQRRTFVNKNLIKTLGKKDGIQAYLELDKQLR